MFVKENYSLSRQKTTAFSQASRDCTLWGGGEGDGLLCPFVLWKAKSLLILGTFAGYISH